MRSIGVFSFSLGGAPEKITASGEKLGPVRSKGLSALEIRGVCGSTFGP